MSRKYSFPVEPVISGMWKFNNSLPVDTLLNLARAWSEGEEGDRYTDIHIRTCSKDQEGIGFKYRLPDGLSDEEYERQFKKFFYKITDQLRRMFGNDFVGWDVASYTCIIK